MIPFALYDDFIQAGMCSDLETEIKMFHDCIQNLPDCNKSLLYKLIIFLSKVASYSQYNKMSVDNLGMVFEPNILRKKYVTRTENSSDSLTTLGNSGTLSKMIQLHDKIF